MKISLKVFVTLGITLLTCIVTFSVIAFYTNLIKKEINTAAQDEIQNLIEKDKSSIIRSIQIGSYLTLNQQLASSYRGEDLVRKVEVYSDKELVASYGEKNIVSTRDKEYRFPLIENDEKWGEIAVLINKEIINDRVSKKIANIYYTGLLILIFAFILSYFFASLITSEINKLVQFIQERNLAVSSAKNLNELEDKLRVKSTTISRFKEISFLSALFEKFLGLITNANLRLNKLESETKLNHQAQQIAHDIRSPLSALELLLSMTNEIPPDKKNAFDKAVSRIADIANTLLEKNKNTLDELTTELVVLSNSINEVLKEKLIIHHHRKDIRIVFDDSSNQNISANVNEVVFKRIVSNILNNAIESLNKPDGRVELSMIQKDEVVLITINDNGKGIPSHVLPSLMERGQTFGKENGNGLGLFHAKESLGLYGGEILLESTENVGTTVTIKLPKVTEL